MSDSSEAPQNKKNRQGFFTGHDPTHRPCQDVINTSRVEWCPVRRCFKSHGTRRMGSDGFQISRVGMGYPDST